MFEKEGLSVDFSPIEASEPNDNLKLSDLILAVFNHSETPKSLKDNLWDFLSENAAMNPFDADLIRLLISHSGIK